MNRYRHLDEPGKRWTPPHELRHSPPRPVRLAGGGIALAVLGIIMVLAAIVGAPLLAVKALRQRADYRAILAEGRETEARVVRLWQKKGENKRNMVEYRFELDGGSYGREASVPTALWKTLLLDGSVRVTYLPSNPEKNQLINRPKKPLSIWVAIVIAMLLLGIAAFMGRFIVRSKELLAQGRVARAVITKIQKVQGEDGPTRILHYEFPVLSGAVAKGKSSDRKGLVVGSVVPVVYDPNQKGRSAIYPLQLVKVGREW